MSLTQNLLYRGPSWPSDGYIIPPALNPQFRIREINATADVADLLTAGTLCYLTGTTNDNDVTPTPADYGKTSQQGNLFVVLAQQHNPAFATTANRPQFPNLMPNTSVTLTDYTHDANTSILVAYVEIGMKLWLRGGNDATFDTVFGYEYICAANGVIVAPADPDGEVIETVAHTFKSLATTTNQNWALVEYMGKHAHDATA